MKKVLDVDDMKAIRNLVIATLRKRDVKMIEAENGEDAVTIAKQEKPDVIIMDVMMPGITGLEATRQIKADPDTQHCVVTFCLTCKIKLSYLHSLKREFLF